MNIIDFAKMISAEKNEMEIRTKMENFKFGVINDLRRKIKSTEQEIQNKNTQYDCLEKCLDSDEYQRYTYIVADPVQRLFSYLNSSDTPNLPCPDQWYDVETESHFYYYTNSQIVDILSNLDSLSFFYASCYLAHTYSGCISTFEKDFYDSVFQQIRYWDMSKFSCLVANANATVFIAMSFSSNMKQTRKTIKTVVEDFGLRPVLIDEKEHSNLIVPEIIREIERCSFLIADFTENKSGVYYEAGIGEGNNKTVIHTCKNTHDDKENLHFDINQKNTIFWEDDEDLSKRLKRRIDAIVF
jgi:hypothetical protein